MVIDRTHRVWALVTLILFLVAAAIYAVYAHRAPHGALGGSPVGLGFGIVGFALMIYAGLLGPRKLVPVWRLGRAQTWMRGHLWLGTLSYPLILFHAGFAMRGTFTTALMIVFTLVIVTGVFGANHQHYVPRVMTVQLPMESIYEQQGSLRAQLIAEADEIVEAVVGALGVKPRKVANAAVRAMSSTSAVLSSGVGVELEVEVAAPLRTFYLKELRPFLQAPHDRDVPLAVTKQAEAAFRHLRTLLPPKLHLTVDQLESICAEERQLTRQASLHRWLHSWLLVHVPLAYALLIMGAVHAVTALRY
jgi:hypothetical protein